MFTGVLLVSLKPEAFACPSIEGGSAERSAICIVKGSRACCASRAPAAKR
jgi:hypothetical protein